MLSFVRLAGDKRGSTAVVFALSIMPLMAAVGCAIDGVRWFDAKRKTELAVDSALLAGARAMQLDGSNEAAALDTAKRVYGANVTARTPVDSDDVDFELVDAKKAIGVKGDAIIKTSFLTVVGVKTLSLIPKAKAAKATFIASGNNKGSDIEISLMLDVTGSMCNDGSGPCTGGVKIDGLKAAAKDLINIVIEDTPNPVYKSRVALVPFATRIRVEPNAGNGSLMKKLTNLDPTWTGYIRLCTAGTWTGGGSSESGGSGVCTAEETQQVSWNIFPCVTERVLTGNWDGTGVDYTDTKPGSNMWLNAHGGNRDPLSWDSTDTNPPTGYDGKTVSTPSYNWNYGGSAWCEDMPDSNTVMPLSSDKAALTSQIDNLEASGATAGALGVAWTWYMLSPNWDTIWTGQAKPGSYADLTAKQPSGAPKLRKVAVLMSDGVFNALRGAKDQSPAMVSNHAKQVCTNMKAAGIEVYSVAFDLDSLSATDRAIAEEVMKNCATDLSHFYSTLTVNDLQAAFRDIALKVSPVRLTQ